MALESSYVYEEYLLQDMYALYLMHLFFFHFQNISCVTIEGLSFP